MSAFVASRARVHIRSPRRHGVSWCNLPAGTPGLHEPTVDDLEWLPVCRVCQAALAAAAGQIRAA